MCFCIVEISWGSSVENLLEGQDWWQSSEDLLVNNPGGDNAQPLVVMGVKSLSGFKK